MNKRGASKGKVLIIALDDNPSEALVDNEGFVLCFDTFKQIAEYCKESNINLDTVLIDEMDLQTGNSSTLSWDDIEEVEF